MTYPTKNKQIQSNTMRSKSKIFAVQKPRVLTWRFGGLVPSSNKDFLVRPIALTASLIFGGMHAGVIAQSLVTPDGRTATTVNRQGSLMDVTTGTVQGGRGFNSFSRFEVGQGDTLNLRLPDGTHTLVNMVYDAPIRIDGVLNSLQNNRIGGKVVFADPFGMVVGRAGVLNVGSLFVTTPTAQAMLGVLGSDGQVNALAAQDLIDGKAAQQAGSLIRIDGRINALERVRLQASVVEIGKDASIMASADARHEAAFASAVNMQGLEAASGMVEQGGVIEIIGKQLSVAGTLNASGRDAGGTIRLGRVDGVQAEQVRVEATGQLQANALLQGNGGLIDVWGDTSNVFLGVISAKGGAQGGDGGFAEVSAKTGLIYDGAANLFASKGKTGTLLIDPDTVCIQVNAGDACSGGSVVTFSSIDSSLSMANFEVKADDTLYVGSTTGTAASGHLSATGNKLTLKGDDVRLNGSTITTGGASIEITTNAGALSNDGSIITGNNAKIATNGGSIELTSTNISVGTGTLLDTRKAGESAGNITLTTKGLNTSPGVASVVQIDGATLNADATTAGKKAGKVSISSADITVKGGATLSAMGGEGEVKLAATHQSIINLFGYKTSSSSVTIDSSTVKSETVDISTESKIENKPFLDLGKLTEPSEIAAYWKRYEDNTQTAALGTFTDLISVEGPALVADLLGINVVFSRSITDSKVSLKGSSVIEGTKSTSIGASATTEAGNSNVFLAKYIPPNTLDLNGKFGLGAMFVQGVADTHVDVASGVKFQGGDLSIKAKNDATLSGSVATDNTDGATGAKFAAAVGVTLSDIKSKVNLASGAFIQSTGHVDISSINRTQVENEVVASTGGSGKASIALALTVQNAKSEVNLGTGIQDALSISLFAGDKQTENKTVAQATAGETPFMRFTKNVSAVLSEEGPATLLAAYKNSKDKNKKDAQATNDPVRIAGAVAVIVGDNESKTTLANGITLHARSEAGEAGSGQIAVGSWTEDSGSAIRATASALTSAGQTAGTAPAAAVTVNVAAMDAVTSIGDNVTISGNQIGVFGQVNVLGREVVDANFFDKDKWSSFKKVSDSLKLGMDTADFGFVNNQVKATGSGEEKGFAGSIGVVVNDYNSHVEVGAGSKLFQNGSGQGVWQKKYELHVESGDASKNEYAQFDAASAISLDASTSAIYMSNAGPLLSTQAKGSGVGISNATVLIDSHANVVVREGVEISGVNETSSVDGDGLNTYSVLSKRKAEDVSLGAFNDNLIVSFAAGGGKSADTSFVYMGTQNFLWNEARVKVDDEATMRAKELSIDAADTSQVFSIAGAVSVASQKSGGAAFGFNYINTDTLSEIANNDTHATLGAASRSSTLIATGAFETDALNAHAHTGGAQYAVAVAGSVSDATNSQGKIGQGITKAKDAANKLMTSFNTMMGDQKVAKSSTPAKAPQDFKGSAFTGAGSLAGNINDLRTTVNLDGAKGQATKIDAVATGDADIVSVAGAGAFTLMGSKSTAQGSTSVAGAVALNVIGNAVHTNANKLDFSNVDEANFIALKGGENLSLALGMTVTTGSQNKETTGFAGVASISFDMPDDWANGTGPSRNNARVTISDSKLVGDGDADLTAVAYNSSLIGTGGGSATAGSKKSVGASITITDLSNDTSVTVSKLTTTGFENETFLAHSASQIVAAAASASVAAGMKDSTALNGSVVVNYVGNTTKVSIDQSSLSATKGTKASATEGVRLSVYEAKLDQGAVVPATDEDGETLGYDYNGSKTFTDSSVAGGGNGSSILAIAGVVQVSTGQGSSNIGASVVSNTVNNDTSVSITDSSNNSGQLDADANSEAYIRAFAVGASGSQDKSIGGSVAVNVIDNDVSAQITGSNARGARANAKDKSSIDALAGQLQVSTSSKGVAGGGAFSVNITSNDLNATVSGGTMTGGLSGGASNLLVSTESTSRIRALNAAGAVSTGSGSSSAFAGSLGVNVITNNQEARASSVTLTAMDGGSDTLSVTAKDDSTIQTLSGSVSATQGSAYGGAMSINTITNDIHAKMVSVNGASLETVKVASESDAQIDALAVGVSASTDKLAIAGSAAFNTISSDSKVVVQGGTISGGQLAVSANDSSDINTLSGSVAVTGGASAAVGAAGSVNSIANEVSADVSSTLTFTGAVNINAKQTGANIKAAAVGAAVSNGGSAIEGSLATNTITNDVLLNVRDSTVSGSTVTIESADTSDIKALAGAAAVSIGGTAVGAALAVNTITNSVNSTVSNSSLTASSGKLKLSASNDSGIFAIGASAAVSTDSKPSVAANGSNNVIVNDTVLAVTGSSLKGVGVEGSATDTAEIDAVNGSIAVSASGVAVGGAIANNNIVNTVRASTGSQLVSSVTKRTDVDAGSSALSWSVLADTEIDALAAGASGTSGTAVSGALVNNLIGKAGQKASVEALIGATDVKAGSVSVKATDSADIASLAGSAALSVGGVAVGGAVSGNTLLGSTRARIDGSDVKAGSGAIEVKASRDGVIRSLAAAGSLATGSASVAPAAAVNTITDDTEAYVTSSTLAGGAGTITAKDSAKIQTLSGAAAVSLGTAGVGFAASVNTIVNTAKAGASASNFNLSGALTSAADNDAKIDSIAVAMSAASTAAVSPSAAVNTVTNTTESKISGSSGSANGATVSSNDATRIRTLTGAVALDFGGGAGVGGAGSVNTITNNSIAELDGGTWNFGSGNVTVSGQNASEIKALAASAGVSANVGVAGSIATETIANDTYARAKNLTISSVGTLSVNAKDDSKMDAIAGAVAAGIGAAGVGAAITVNTIANDVGADVDNINVTTSTGVAVESTSGAKIQSIAAAGAGSSGAAVGGSSSTNTIVVNNSATLDGSTISTGTLNVAGSDSSIIRTLAGSVALSGGVSVGAALAVNTITNDNIAHVGSSSITHTGAASISSKNTEAIEALAAAAAGSTGLSISGSVAVNTITNDTMAEIDGASLLGGTTGDVSVAASDAASIKSISGAAAFGGGTSVGVAVASNIITNDVDAKLRGGSKTVGFHNVAGRHVTVDADSSGAITSMTMAGAADATAGVAGSASVNVIANDTRAVVDRNADVLADGNVVVTSESVNDIKAIGGAIGVGLAAAGAGAAIGVSVISGETSATIGGNDGVNPVTKIDGLGNATASTITTGELTAAPSVGLPSKSDLKAFAEAPLITGTQSVKGVAVTAESRRRILEGAATAGASSTAAVAVTVNANANLASTSATIQDASINTRGTAGAEQDVNVIAANHSLGNSFVGSIAVQIGVGAAVGGAFQGSGMGIDTKARILNSTVNAADDVIVKARATETSNAMVVGLAAGMVGVQGSAAVTVLRGTTEAAIYDGSVTAGDDVTVKAHHDAGFGTVVGALSGGLVGAGFAMNVGVNNHTTIARIGAGETGGTESTSVSAHDVTVDADSSTTAKAATVVGAAGGAAFGGAVGVVVLDDTAKAFVNKTTLTVNDAGKTSVTADLSTTLTQIGGAAAVGGVSGGASLGVALSRGIADAYIKDSTVTTGQLQLEANNLQDLDTASISAALAGASGFAGSIQVSMIGYGSTGDRMGDLTKDDGAFTKASTFSNSNHLGENKNGDGSAYDDTNSKESKFSTQNRDTINNSSKYDFASRLSATGANTTRARVINSQVTLATDASVKANTEAGLRNSVGAVGVGLGFAGVAASVAVSRVNNDVQASIDATSKILSSNASAEADVSVLASAKDRSGSWSLGDTKRGIVSRAATGAASLGFSGAATVSDNVIDNAVSATVVPAQIKADNVTLSASDSMSITGDALAGQISTAAAGAAVTLSERKGSVSALFTPGAGGNSEITSLDVTASGGGLASGKVKAGVVGLGASLSGNVATVKDSQGVLAQVGTGADVDVTGNVSLEATRRPELEVDVVGVGVSAGLQVSASVATASVSGNTTAEVLGGDVYSGKATVRAQNLRPLDGGLNISGDALAAGGGLLLGANGAVVTVSDDTDVLAHWKDNSLAGGAMEVLAYRATSQSADATAVSVGFIGAGAVLATSNATGDTHASIENWSVSSMGRSTDVSVIAESTYNSTADAAAGTGGIVAGSAAIARNNMQGATTAKLASTSANALNAGFVTLRAQRTNEFNARVNTVNASLVGASGASIDNDVNTSTTAEVGAGSKLLVESFNALAKGIGRKTWWDGDAGENGTANINSGSGGLVDAPGATSETDYRQSNTVTIGAGASLEVDESRGTLLSVIRLDTASDIILRDKVVMNSGGAIPIAKGVSKQEVKQDTNTVTIGANSDVIANKGSLKVGSQSVVDLDARVNVDTYGLAGAPDAQAWAKYTGSNTVTVDTNAETYGDTAVLLASGMNSSEVLNKFKINSDARTWNKTAIPIPTGPDAVSELNSSNALWIKAGSINESGRDIDLVALSGSDDINVYFGRNANSSVTATGIGKDIYREAGSAIVSGISNAFGGDDVSFDMKKSTINRSTSGTVTVDGTVRVGLNRTEKLVIDNKVTNEGTYDIYDTDGVTKIGTGTKWGIGYTITEQTGGIGAISKVQQAVGQETWDRILWLRQKQADYAGTVEAAGYKAEADFLENRLIAQGLATRAADGSIDFGRGSTGGLSPYDMAKQAIDSMTSQVANMTTVKTTAESTKATADAVNTKIQAVEDAATVVGKAQGNISGGSNTLASLNTVVTKELADKATADSTYSTKYTAATAPNQTLATSYLTAAAKCDVSCSTAEATAASKALTDLKAADSALGTAAETKVVEGRQYTVASTNLTTRQGEVNTLVATFNTAQNDTALNGVITRVTISDYSTDITKSTVDEFDDAQKAYKTSTLDPATNTYNQSVSELAEINAAITTQTNNLASLSKTPIAGVVVDQLIIPDITVNLGDVRIRSNQLKGASTGSISAPGDAQVTIKNNSSSPIKVNNISISSDGGNVRLNGFLVDNNTEINRINQIDGTSTSSIGTINTRRSSPNLAEIKIESTYNPENVTDVSQRRPSPDIVLATGKTIFNPDGRVVVTSESGSVLSQGNIRAGTLEITAKNGDFVQGYVNGFFHVGADPKARFDGSGTTVEQCALDQALISTCNTRLSGVTSNKYQSGGIVANGAVMLSARYLNINGTVQSGITDWQVTLDNLNNTLAIGDAAFFGLDANAVLTARAAYLNDRGSGLVKTGNVAGARYRSFTGTNGISVAYDADQDELTSSYTAAAAANLASNGQYRLKTSGINDNIGATYDKASDQFLIDGTAVKGGYIKLFGTIMNTEDPNLLGNGGTTPAGLKVADGFGNITINNSTGKNVAIGNLDAGSGAVGRLEISDIREVEKVLKTAATTETKTINIPFIGDITFTVETSPAVYDYNPILKNTTYTRDASGNVLSKTWMSGSATPANNTAEPATWTTLSTGRSASYAPKADIRYQYATGKDQSTIREYQRVTRNFFGADSLGVDEWYQGELIRGPFVQNAYDIPDGQRLVVNGAIAGEYIKSTSTTIADGAPTMDILRRWSECDVWLCITSRKYTQYRVTTPEKTITLTTVKGDHSIPISFIGSDSGSINITSNSNIGLQGNIRNLNGSTTITASNGSIAQSNDAATITSKSVILRASGAVGTENSPIRISSAEDRNHPLRGIPDVTISGYANNGDFRVRQFNANTIAGNVSSSGMINIFAKGSITSADANSVLQAKRVELTASEGSVGDYAADAPINVRLQSTDDPLQYRSHGLRIQARDNVNVYNKSGTSAGYGGELLVDSVTASLGSVRLRADGKIVDGNPDEAIDPRTWNALVAFWDATQLRGAASIEKQDKQVKAFENRINRDYQAYWGVRNSQADPSVYDNSYQFSLTTAERQVFIDSGMTSTQVDQYVTGKTAEYHALHTRLNSLNVTGTSYNAGFNYQATVQSTDAVTGKKTYELAEINSMLRGGSWSDRELGIALTPGLLKEVTNTNVTVKDPNVNASSKIELYSNQGVGRNSSTPVVVDLSKAPELLTNAEKVALAAAERADLSLSGNTVTIVQNKPLNVLAASLTAEGLTLGTNSAGPISIASRGNLALDSVKTDMEARIKVVGNLTAGGVSPAANVTANTAILEAAEGTIGLSTSALRIAASGTGSYVTARSKEGIYLTAPETDLTLDTIYSQKHIELVASKGAIQAAFSDGAMDVRGKTVNFTANGNIGSSSAYIDVGVDAAPDGLINATSTAGSVYLRGTDNAAFILGNVSAGGDISLDADTLGGVVNGNIIANGSVSIVGGDDLTIKGTSKVTAKTGNLIVAVEDLIVDPGAVLTAGKIASFDAESIAFNGTLNTGSGQTRLNATVGDLTMGPNALIVGTGTGNFDAFGKNITMAETAKIQQNGYVRMTANGTGTNQGVLSVSQVIGGNIDVNAKAGVVGVGATNTHLRSTAIGGQVRVNTANIAAAGVTQGTGIGTTGQALRVATGRGYASTLTGDVNLKVLDAGDWSTISTGSGSVTVQADKGFTAQRVAGTGALSLTAATNGISVLDAISVTGGLTANAPGSLYFNNIQTAQAISLQAGTALTVGKATTNEDFVARSGAAMQVSQVQAGKSISLAAATGNLTSSNLNALNGTLAVSASAGALTVGSAQASQSVSLVGTSVTNNSAKSGTGTDVQLQATGGNISYGQIDSAQDVRLIARDTISNQSGSLIKASRDASLQAASVSAGNISANLGGTGGKVSITGTSALASAGAISGSQVTVSAGTNAALASVNTAGALNLTAGGTANVANILNAATAKLISTGNASVQAGTIAGSLQLLSSNGAAVLGSSGKTVNAVGIQATGATVNAAGIINSSNGITLTSNSGAISAASPAALKATTGEIVVNAKTSATIANAQTTAGNITISSGAGQVLGTISAGHAAGTGGDVLLTATAGGLNFSQLSAGRDVNVTVRDAITRASTSLGHITAAGTVTMKGLGLTLGNVQAGGLLSLTSTSQAVAAGRVASTAGDAVIKSASNVTLAQLQTLVGGATVEAVRDATITQLHVAGFFGLKVGRNATLGISAGTCNGAAGFNSNNFYVGNGLNFDVSFGTLTVNGCRQINGSQTIAALARVGI